MKKLLLLLVLASSMVGCTPNEEIEINIYETSYEEHSYLVKKYSRTMLANSLYW